MQLREQVRAGDAEAVEALVRETGFFREDEVEVARELVDETLEKGDAAGYSFLFAERDGEVLGYACYGQVPCTLTSWDLYWIAVRPDLQGQGVGRVLMQAAEARVAERGGVRLYVETSGRADYASTRAFYLRCAYDVGAELEDFYAPGDSKVIFVKRVG